LRHELDRLIDLTVEKANTEDLHSRGHRANVQRSRRRRNAAGASYLLPVNSSGSQNFSVSVFQRFKVSYVPGLQRQSAVEAVTSANLVATDRAPGRAGAVFLILALGALWFVCCHYLSTEWTFNEQYNYGWFVPFFAAYLFWLRWEDRARGWRRMVGGRRFATANPSLDGSEVGSRTEVGKVVAIFLIVCAALILLPLRVFEIGSADWRPLAWVHVAAAATITLSTIYLIGGINWLRQFSFPVLFVFVAVPWPTPVEAPIVQGLMRLIAASAAETLALLGIPAEVQGNLIRLPSGTVGVNEACSGVRSLQTSLMIGLLFGEVKRLRIGPRLVLIGSAVAIAMVANFLRASFLVWIASTRNLTAVGQWHDIAGYTIVALVFVGTLWIASQWKTDDNGRDAPPGRPDGAARRPHLVRTSAAAALLLWVLAVEIGAEFWYRLHERNLVARATWSVRWPEKLPGYREIKIDQAVRNILRFDSGREATWGSQKNGVSTSRPIVNYLFFFRWNPGEGTILRARAHRPDICLPAAGWQQVGHEQLVDYQIDSNHSLPFRTFHFVKENGSEAPIRATAFFTLHEDAVHQGEGDSGAGLYSNWDWKDRWRVVRNGIRNRGQQVLELIMVMPPQISDSIADEECGRLMREIVVPRETGSSE
jgi:exosortase